jgi:hypothetical protein
LPVAVVVERIEAQVLVVLLELVAVGLAPHGQQLLLLELQTLVAVEVVRVSVELEPDRLKVATVDRAL